jgi:hypothetical protein
MTKHTHAPMMRRGCERCETAGERVIELIRLISEGENKWGIMLCHAIAAQLSEGLPRRRKGGLRLVKGSTNQRSRYPCELR